MNQASSGDLLDFVIAGCLNRDTILPISGPPQIDVPGGHLAYAAAGLKVWGGIAGLMSRVGADYPKEWLDRFKSYGFDLSGVNILSEPIDTRRFIAHVDSRTAYYQNPVQHFADRGLPFPSDLLGYRGNRDKICKRSTPGEQSLQISDTPENYLEASAVHICPIDFLSHVLMPSVFHQGMATMITLSPNPGYMSPSFWEDISSILSEITAFITFEEDIRNLFQGRRTDLWEMAEVLADYGAEFIIIQTDSWGYYLFDRISHKRWVVPNYQTKVVDPTGELDAFAGGFLVGYRTHYDPLEAALMGSISASLVVESSGVFYAMDAMPSLIEARRTALRDLVGEV